MEDAPETRDIESLEESLLAEMLGEDEDLYEPGDDEAPFWEDL